MRAATSISSVMINLKNGFGEHSMWGLSPSYNVLRRVQNQKDSNFQNEDTINILLVKPGDVRHIIHTVAQRQIYGCEDKSSASKPIKIFILESEIEVLARHLLQLHVFLGENPIRHRSALYLELYNAFISKRTQDFVSRAAKELGKLVYGEGADNEHLENIVDFSWLKQKDRDGLYSVFNSWKCPVTGDNGEYDVSTLRDYRLRGYYEDRYDW